MAIIFLTCGDINLKQTTYLFKKQNENKILNYALYLKNEIVCVKEKILCTVITIIVQVFHVILRIFENTCKQRE